MKNSAPMRCIYFAGRYRRNSRPDIVASFYTCVEAESFKELSSSAKLLAQG